ncbi:hypothetical protein HDU77_000784, partial [Chytriomyces hyalinus]
MTTPRSNYMSQIPSTSTGSSGQRNTAAVTHYHTCPHFTNGELTTLLNQTPNSNHPRSTHSPAAQQPGFSSRAIMDAFGFSPRKKQRLDKLSQHELTAGIAVLAESLNEAKALENWTAAFKLKSYPLITTFFYACLGVTSFTATSDFKSKRGSIFRTLDMEPIHA